MGGDSEILDAVLRRVPQVEAVVRLSRDGLLLSRHARNAAAIEELSVVGADILHAVRESGLTRDEEKRRVTVEAEHGTMYLREMGDQTVMLVLVGGTGGRSTVASEIERAFAAAGENTRKTAQG